MQRLELGATKLTVSNMALGTWGLSGDGYGEVSEAVQDKVIERARLLGITTFETADVYGNGSMERRLGEKVGSDPKCVIVTKVGTDRDNEPARKCFKPQFLRERIDACAERLGRTPDVVLLHNPSHSTVERDDACRTMRELAASGAFKAWGVSAGSAEVGREAIAHGAQVLELAYNAFLSEDLTELEEDIRMENVGVLARSVLAHGLLAGHWSFNREFPDEDHRSERWTPTDLRRRVNQLEALRSLVGGDVLTMRAVALRFVLATEQVTSAVLGPRNIVQLDQLVREAGRTDTYLTAMQLTKLNNRLRDVGVLR